MLTSQKTLFTKLDGSNVQRVSCSHDSKMATLISSLSVIYSMWPSIKFNLHFQSMS